MAAQSPLVAFGPKSVWAVGTQPSEEILACSSAPLNETPIVALISTRRVVLWAVSPRGAAEIGACAWPATRSGSALVAWSKAGTSLGAIRRGEGDCELALFGIERAEGAVLDASCPLAHGEWGLKAAQPTARFDDAPPISRATVRPKRSWFVDRISAIAPSPFVGDGGLVILDSAGRLVEADQKSTFEDGDVLDGACASTGSKELAVVCVRLRDGSCVCSPAWRSRPALSQRIVVPSQRGARTVAIVATKAHPYLEARLAIAWAAVTCVSISLSWLTRLAALCTCFAVEVTKTILFVAGVDRHRCLSR